VFPDFFNSLGYKRKFQPPPCHVRFTPNSRHSSPTSAFVFSTSGSFRSEAEPLHQRALAIREKTLGPEHPHVATSLNNLAELYRTQGHYAKTEPLLQRSLAILEKALGPEHPRVAQSLNNLALLYQIQERYAEAEPLYRRAMQIKEKSLGSEHRKSAFRASTHSAILPT
jgi:tetratricopeptide (TPR) repeat protein